SHHRLPDPTATRDFIIKCLAVSCDKGRPSIKLALSDSVVMPPRPTSPALAMDLISCSGGGGGREPSLSPPLPPVVAPVAVKPQGVPVSVSEGGVAPMADQQQRLLYQLALAERLRLASAGLAWAPRPQFPPQTPQGPGSLPESLQPPQFPLMTGPQLVGLGHGGVMASPWAMQGLPNAPPFGLYSQQLHPLYGPYRGLMDPRALLPRLPEEPKPQHSYIGLIAMAILSSPDKKLILSDIYQYILDNYPYFRSRGTGWRNSIRHNLSLNDCFIKAGRAANGKGHYWAIHPANVSDFQRGDYRRRRAQRRVRKHLGLQVDDDSDPEDNIQLPITTQTTPPVSPNASAPSGVRPRPFDMLSLLAPDHPRPRSPLRSLGDQHVMSPQEALLLSLRRPISPLRNEDPIIDVSRTTESPEHHRSPLSNLNHGGCSPPRSLMSPGHHGPLSFLEKSPHRTLNVTTKLPIPDSLNHSPPPHRPTITIASDLTIKPENES
ncbi:unnamed protein product, partial [Meganyctiphanes norvegica]